MENVDKVLSLSGYVILYCIAILLLFAGNRTLNHVWFSAKTILTESHAIDETEGEEEEEPKIDSDGKQVVLKKDLIAMLMNGIDTNVRIDGILIEKSSYYPETFQYSMITRKRYRCQVVINQEGIVQELVYIGE